MISLEDAHERKKQNGEEGKVLPAVSHHFKLLYDDLLKIEIELRITMGANDLF